jgi:hypothetical protein
MSSFWIDDVDLTQVQRLVAKKKAYISSVLRHPALGVALVSQQLIQFDLDGVILDLLQQGWA